MKAVKIIVSFIGVLLLVFLATGILVKEIKYTTEIQVDKPVSEVFSAFTNQDLLKEWMPEIQHIETLNETSNKVGSTYKMIIISEGEKVEMLEEVLAYELNKKMTFSFNANDMLKTDAYYFSDNGSTTLIRKESICKADSYIISCLFPYFKGMLKDIDQNYLNKFKTVVEK